MMLITSLFYCLPLISSRSCTNEVKSDKLNDKYQYKEGRLDIGIVDIDKNIAEVCNRLNNLDNILTKMYKNPPVDGGDEMLRLSRTYNQACLDLLYLCTIDKFRALKAAQDIIDPGCPKFLDVDVDEKTMEERFKWDEEQINGMYIIRKKINEHWYDIWHLYNNLPN